MARLQETLRALMHDLESDLVKSPLPPDLEMKLCKSEAEWCKVRRCQEDIRLICPSDPSLRGGEDLKELYLELSGKVQAALERHQSELEDRRLREESNYRARLLGEDIKFLHEELERIMFNTKSQLEKEVGTDVRALEMFNIQLDATMCHLDFAGELLGTAQAAIDRLTSDFPEQTVISMEEQLTNQARLEWEVEA